MSDMLNAIESVIAMENVTTIESVSKKHNAFGLYLKDCRTRLDPTDFGFPGTRRRTPGLRREEVAQRADLSVTWYTWLEQGRGGVPSADVLERLAQALVLTPAEREHLFLLAQQRPPKIRYPLEKVGPHLQGVLDALEFSPAIIKNATWDVLAWNRAAAAVLTDYGTLEKSERNILRLLFCDTHSQTTLPHWEDNARSVVATFRLEVARAGTNERSKSLVEELSHSSPEFRNMWRDNEVSSYAEGIKHIVNLEFGPITLEYSTFAVDNQPSLSLVIFNPATPLDMERIRSLVNSRASSSTLTLASLTH
jgi:transcriptional regulator with XRE-family HTH domain